MDALTMAPSEDPSFGAPDSADHWFCMYKEVWASAPCADDGASTTRSKRGRFAGRLDVTWVNRDRYSTTICALPVAMPTASSDIPYVEVTCQTDADNRRLGMM